MNWVRAEGNWLQVKGRLKEQWGRLTANRGDIVAGQRDQLVGQIQQLFGIGKDVAERRVRAWEEDHRRGCPANTRHAKDGPGKTDS
jgi:uncharacterized protein YjbJ (UPF0337 family)